MVEGSGPPTPTKTPFEDDDDDSVYDTHSGGRIISSELDTIREEDDETSIDSARSRTSAVEHISNLRSLILFAFPRGDPVSWRDFFIMTAAVLFPSIFYILFFTKMGVGLSTFYYVSSLFQDVYRYVAIALLVFIFVLYLLDFNYWDTKKGIWVRWFCWFVFAVGVIFVVLCVANSFPYGPISIFTILIPAWLMLIKDVFYHDTEYKQYVRWLCFPFFTASVLVGVSWVVWTLVSEANRWNAVNRLRDSIRSGCMPNLKDFPECRDITRNEPDQACFEIDFQNKTILFHAYCDRSCTQVYLGASCLNTFIIWVGPLMVSASLFFFSFFCTFLRTTTTRNDGTIVQEVVNFGKLWLVLLFLVWITAAYGGVGPQGIVSALAALTLAGFVGSMVFLSKVLSQHEQKGAVESLRDQLKARYGAFIDVTRGLLVLLCTPLMVPYLCMSVLIQFVRRSQCFPYSKSAGAIIEGDGLLNYITDETRIAIQEFRKWDRAKIYCYAIYWGIAFMTLQVLITKFVYLFMSWLIETIKPLGIPLITLIMIVVGLILFLLPPVPGTPIFLALGAVSVGTFEEKLTLVGAIFYAIFVSLFIKLLSNVLQQRCIGENLSHSIAVRQLVRINSDFVRAMKLVMYEPGLNITKVCIFVGGPDWPTSVMCGIIRVSYVTMLLGSLPVLVLITPMVLSASFAYMGSVIENEELKYPWAGTTSVVMLAIAIGTQFGSFLLAALSLEQVMVERKDELRAIPIDKEVFEVEETFKRRRKAYREVTKWENLSRLNKIILSWALSCMIVCVYLVQLFQSLCFREFELSSKIEDDLGGDWKRIVLPFGWVVLALLFVSCVLLTIFICNARRKANSSSVKSGKTISNSVTVQTKGGATTSGVGISSSDISVLSDSSSVHSGVTVQTREGTTISGVGNSSISVLSNSSSVNSGVIINEEESSY